MNSDNAQTLGMIQVNSGDRLWDEPSTQLTATSTGEYTTGTIKFNDVIWWDGHEIYPLYPRFTQLATVIYCGPQSPLECSGDVHVFPCPHCDKCKCGAATVKREKRAQTC